MDNGIGFRPQAGGIRKEVATTVERWEPPHCSGFRILGEAGDEMLSRFPHDLRKRPILLLGYFFEPPVERIGELDLSACHDAFHTSFLQ